MGKRHLNHFLFVCGLGIAVFVLTSIFRSPDPPLGEIHSLDHWQFADSPSGYPVNVTQSSPGYVPEFDHRFILLDAFERYRLPEIKVMEMPMGAENGSLTYNAQSFGEDNPQRGGRHTGDDINGIGGRNSDQGDPVFAIANGEVLYAGLPAPGWGNTVIVGHRLEDGRVLQSMYSHLERIDVARGALLARGEKVGTVGTASGRYLAHLHFEVRESDTIDLGAGYTRFDSNRMNPTKTVRDFARVDGDRLGVSPLAVATDISWEGNLILENAHLLPDTRE